MKATQPLATAHHLCKLAAPGCLLGAQHERLYRPDGRFFTCNGVWVAPQNVRYEYFYIDKADGREEHVPDDHVGPPSKGYRENFHHYAQPGEVACGFKVLYRHQEGTSAVAAKTDRSAVAYGVGLGGSGHEGKIWFRAQSRFVRAQNLDPSLCESDGFTTKPWLSGPKELLKDEWQNVPFSTSQPRSKRKRR